MTVISELGTDGEKAQLPFQAVALDLMVLAPASHLISSVDDLSDTSTLSSSPHWNPQEQTHIARSIEFDMINEHE